MDTSKMESLYNDIANDLMDFIPEEWSRVLLYARIDEGTTIVYFYYYPMNSKDSEYSLEISDKWDMSKQEYNSLRRTLENHLETLWNEFKIQKQQQWTNLTLVLDRSGHIDINYDYRDLSESDSYEEHIIWRFKYLGLSPDESRKADIKILNEYLKNSRNS